MCISLFLKEKVNEGIEILAACPDEETKDAILDFRERYPGIVHYHKQEREMPKNDLMNDLMKKTKGRIIIFTDGNKFIQKGAVSHIIHSFKDERVGCVGGRIVPLNKRDNIFGYWAHLLTNAANVTRLERFRSENGRKYIEFSANLLAIKNNVIKDIPTDVAEDAVIPYMFFSRNYRLVYNDKAMIIVGDKSPANQILLAGEISIYLASIGTIVKSSKIFSSSQVKDDDLVKAINSFCGNNFCESGEDQTNCPNDCPIIKTVNCITPQQVSSQNSWQVDKDITLCPGRYDLLDDVSIVKDGIVLDCGGAELRGVKTNPRTLFLIKANNVNIKNCNFANIGFTTAFVNGIVIENNNFDHWTSLGLITSNSLIKNNDVNGVLLWSPGATTPPLQNNRFINNNIRGEFAIADSYNNEIVSNNINNLNIARISGNVIKNNRFILNKPSPAYDESGLHIIGGNNNSFENNEIIKNMQYNRLVTAIDLINSQNNKFSKNIIRNFDKGIVIDSTSQNNEFKNNNLINNQLSQIIDNSAAPNIYLNNFITGFSDDPQKCNDLNNDNICDNPFVISAGLQDSKPSKIPN